jgi:hypothetical protein
MCSAWLHEPAVQLDIFPFFFFRLIFFHGLIFYALISSLFIVAAPLSSIFAFTFISSTFPSDPSEVHLFLSFASIFSTL